jgi:uncharacterized membrane protein YraQ (UPF0718 family)
MEHLQWLWLGLYHAAAMGWGLLWALVLGFTLSGVLQVFVSKEQMSRAFGRTNLRSMALATIFGGASSSCSYAAAATGRSALRKGAALIPTLAFMFASTNLVIELGAVLWIVLGWRFVLAEAVGSVVLIGLLWILARLIFPRELEDEARRHAEEAGQEGGCCGHAEHEDHDHGHGHGHDDAPATFAGRVRQPGNWRRVADSFAMDWQMLWKEIVIGFLIGGFLAALVPDAWWRAVFLTGVPGPWRLLENVVAGPILAALSFVCSIGNVPVASLLWSGGISFGGVVAYLYGDLLVIPLISAYRKYYGGRTAFYITLVFFLSMVGAGLIVDLLFNALGLVPHGARPPSVVRMAGFAWNYTTWLNIPALMLAGWFVYLHRQGKDEPEPGTHEHVEHAASGVPPG